MAQSRRNSKSFSSRAKLGWLSLLLVVILVLCCYINYSSPRLGRLPSSQHEKPVDPSTGRETRLKLSRGFATTTSKSSHRTELLGAGDFSNSATPREPANIWTSMNSQDKTRTKVAGETTFSQLTTSDHDAKLSASDVKNVPSAGTDEVTRSYYFSEKDRIAESVNDSIGFQGNIGMDTEDNLPDPKFEENEYLEFDDNDEFGEGEPLDLGDNNEFGEGEPLDLGDNNEFGEGEPLGLGDSNEFNYVPEEDEVINSTDISTFYDDMEIDDGKNSNETHLKYYYTISKSQFGIVFADIEPSDDEEEGDGDPPLVYTASKNEFDGEKIEALDANDQHDPQPKEIYNGESRNIRPPTLSSLPESSLKGSLVSTSSKSVEQLFSSLKRRVNSSDPHCAITTRFSSWEKGVVTQLGIPIRRDCKKLRTTTAAEVRKVKLKTQVGKWRGARPWEHFAMKFKTKSCDEIRAEFENNFYVSEVEKEFPLAYIFVVYTNAGQILRLLKAIYRPHNLYCIHPDARQGPGFASFFKSVAKCLDNVFVVSKLVRVYYGHISITDAQLHCMRDLMSYTEDRWKYAINLCGREVPLRTNREIVEALKKMKGYTALQLRHLTPNFWTSRFKYRFRLGRNRRIHQTRQRQSKPPKGIRLYKSMNFIAASRQFVSFLLHNPLSQRLRRYLGTVYAPEEHFYSSLYALPQAKGARPPKGALGKTRMPIVDMFIWINTKWQSKNKRYYCPGRRVVHGICILTVRENGTRGLTQ